MITMKKLLLILARMFHVRRPSIPPGFGRTNSSSEARPVPQVFRQYLSLLVLGLSVLATQAQTNITLVLTVQEGAVRTNTYTNTLASLAVTGAHVAYASYLAADTNNTATFRGFVRTYTKDLTEVPLKELGRRYELQQAKIDSILTSITANWETASAADRKLLTDWLAKYPVTP